MATTDTTSTLRLRKCRFLTEEVRRLYMASFPPEERRPLHYLDFFLWQPTHPSSLLVAEVNEHGHTIFVGFITLWKLSMNLYYIEHFAVEPSMRGNGIGAEILTLVSSSIPAEASIIIEVELPDNDLALRRIDFYKRCGFELLADYEYFQPAYSNALPEVRMMLMIKKGLAPLDDIKTVVSKLKSTVYHK